MNSNFYDDDTSTSQTDARTDRRTDRQTIYHCNTALCATSHCIAVMIYLQYIIASFCSSYLFLWLDEPIFITKILITM